MKPRAKAKYSSLKCIFRQNAEGKNEYLRRGKDGPEWDTNRDQAMLFDLAMQDSRSEAYAHVNKHGGEIED